MNQALARREQTGIATEGSFTDAHRATEALREAAKLYNLVSPATSCGDLPEGCALALSSVLVNEQNDTYNLKGKRGLSKSTLQKIGHASGVSWDPIASGRIDDGSHPFYCRWRAVGRYKAFDGQVQTIVAEKELDLRDRSATCVALEEQQRKKGESADGQIREMRQHIQAHAETKSQLRALRSLGIKTAYTSEELRKPFLVARVMFTGHSEDPETRRMFQGKIADSFLGAQASLYGGGVPMQAAQKLLPPPPVNRTQPDLESAEYDVDTGDVRGFTPPTEPANPGPASFGTREPEDDGYGPEADEEPARSGVLIPGGHAKDLPIEEAVDKDLAYWENRLRTNLENNSSRSPERDRTMQKAMAAEIARRAKAGY